MAQDADDGQPTYHLGGVTYRLQYTCCSKAKCRTCRGSRFAHGPYWFAFWTVGGRTRSKYIGKVLPSEVTHAIAYEGGYARDPALWTGGRSRRRKRNPRR